MTTRNELLALADRVEAATGPDRELNLLIEKAMGRYTAFSHYRLGDDDQPDYQPEGYTASLDAALTLVPEGWRWMVGHAESQYAAVLAHDTEEGVMRPLKPAPEAVAATPALALVAASLRAIAEEPIP